jgi:hypothetical protein
VLLDIDTFTGTAARAVVLEALALELILKARLLKAAMPLKYTHNHIDLFAKLPQSERTADEEEFRALLNIPMVRTTPRIRFLRASFLGEQKLVPTI